jgi:hypothetical protein
MKKKQASTKKSNRKSALAGAAGSALPVSPAKETGDKCSMCGGFTDSIMQSSQGMVCESCLENCEPDERNRW